MPAIDVHVSQGGTHPIQTPKFKSQARPRASNFGGIKTGHVDRSHLFDDLLNKRCLSHAGLARNQCLGMSQPHRAIILNIEIS
jgi:hypothetical protein